MENSEERLRQEAVRMHLKGISVSKIARELSKSRQWIYKWISRYNSSPNSDWYKEESRAPKSQSIRISGMIENSVIEIRKSLSSNSYSQKGATSILYEMKRLGLNTTSVSTINRILKRNDLISLKKTKSGKPKEYPNHYLDVQQMDLIGPRYLKGGFKYYIYTIIDINNHMAGAYPIVNKSAKNITECLIDFWSEYQMPDYLQMDNELSFRGSNRHPRGLGLLLRTAISNGVTPVFIPPAEPWRNGIIEKFNDNVGKRFLTQPFLSWEDIQIKAKEFTDFHNMNHRYSSQGNKTPYELLSEIKYLSKLDKQIDLDKKIRIEKGYLIFIRFIRSDLKLNLLNSSFIVSEQLMYSYVEAFVQIEKHTLVVIHHNKVYHYFEFPMPMS